MTYTVHRILQARVLEWVAFPFSRGSSWPRDRTRVSWIAGRFFIIWVISEAPRSIGALQTHNLSINWRVLICCTCHFQSGSPLFILASSVCQSLQCLISTLTQGGEGGHLFRLTCSAVSWAGRDTENKYYWHMWGVLTVDGPYCVCHSPRWRVLPRSTLLRLQGALQGHCVPGGSCVSSSSQVHAAQVLRCSAGEQTQIGYAFCALPRSEQLRQPGALWVHCPKWVVHLIHFPRPGHSVSRECYKSAVPDVPWVSEQLISGCDTPGRWEPSRIPGRRC